MYKHAIMVQEKSDDLMKGILSVRCFHIWGTFSRMFDLGENV